MKLRRNTPATRWLASYPIGNGHIGAMIRGDFSFETIVINDDTLYAGHRFSAEPSVSPDLLKRVRELIFHGDYGEAERLCEKEMLGDPPCVRSYQELCRLCIEGQPDVCFSGSELDLETGVAVARGRYREGSLTRTYFASGPKDAFVIRQTADRPFSCRIYIEDRDHAEIRYRQGYIELSGQILDEPSASCGEGGPGMRFAALAKIQTSGGTMKADKSCIELENVNDFCIIYRSKTNYDFDHLDIDESLDPLTFLKDVDTSCGPADPVAWETEAAQEFSEHFSKASLTIGPKREEIPALDELFLMDPERKGSPALCNLLFDFGRYLLISSSRRPGTLPANLQGIWGEGYQMPWNADFHTNINLQMNYWPAHVTGLAETANLLNDFICLLALDGRETARKTYGVGAGWTVNHLTDPFGKTCIHDGVSWGTFPIGGAWLALHLYEHYLYTCDAGFLKERAYPVMKSACDFLLGFMVEKNGYLVTCPSSSPENKYLSGGRAYGFTYASTMDIGVTRELFQATLEASKILDDGDFSIRISDALQKLPPYRISRRYGGTLCEWIEDYEETEPGHRHVSHLFALHPGSQFTSETPDYLEAARKTLERRLINGGAHTGWSKAWTAMFYARLGDGESFEKHISEMAGHCFEENLFDMHPPFQIDGNFGFTAAVAEALIQSHEKREGVRVVSLLPACPREWDEGSVRGFRTRSGLMVDFAWKDHVLVSLSVRSIADVTVYIQGPGLETSLRTFKKGEAKKII